MDMHTKERPADVLMAVHHELSKALAKFPTWPTDPLHALAVLGEEFGELTKDVLQMTYEPGKTSAENVRKEAIQTAAMALRFVASLDAYIYKAAEQHRQEQWKAQQDAYAASGGERYFAAEFEVWQGDEMCASTSGPRDEALRDAMHYATQYGQDGPVRVFEVTRKLVTPNVELSR